MKTFSLPIGLAFLAAFPEISHAYYACSLSNAVPASSLVNTGGSSGGSSGGASGGSSGGYIPTSAGCSFYIAAGGTCTTSHNKDKRGAAVYSTLPCLDDMTCINAGGRLGCIDVTSGNYIDDEGACGNTKTGETETGCVQKFLAEQSSSAAATGPKATNTGSASAAGATASKATGSGSSGIYTAAPASSNGGLSSSNEGARVAAGSLMGLLVSMWWV